MDRPIRIETPVLAAEMTAKQARAAAGRLVPALAALSARAADRDLPAPLLVETADGTVLFIPCSPGTEPAAALATLRETLAI